MTASRKRTKKLLAVLIAIVLGLQYYLVHHWATGPSGTHTELLEDWAAFRTGQDCQELIEDADFEAWLEENREIDPSVCLELARGESREESFQDCSVWYSEKKKVARFEETPVMELFLRSLKCSKGNEKENILRLRQARCFQMQQFVEPAMNFFLEEKKSMTNEEKFYDCESHAKYAPEISSFEELNRFLEGGACSLKCTERRSLHGECCQGHIFGFPKVSNPQRKDGESAVLVTALWDQTQIPWGSLQPYCHMNIAKAQIPNMGDEASSYIAFILRQYKQRLPDYTIFMHGQGSDDHDISAADLVKDFALKEKPRRIGRNKQQSKTNSKTSVLTKAATLLNALDVSISDYIHLTNPTQCRRKRIEENDELFQALNAFCHVGMESELSKPSREEKYAVNCCAQFSVHRNVIRRIPFRLWQELLLYLLDDPCHRFKEEDGKYLPCRCHGERTSRGCKLEYLWPFLWSQPFPSVCHWKPATAI